MPLQILIVAPPRRALSRALRRARGTSARWAYFGETVPKALTCSRRLQGIAEQVMIGPLLQEVGQKCRGEFIEYIGCLSAARASDSWWLGSVSEKNPYVSKLFLHACYLLTAERLMSGQAGGAPLLLVVENRAVRQTLATHLRAKKTVEVVWQEPWGSKVLGWLTETAECWVRRGWFVARHLGRIVAARLLQPRPQDFGSPSGLRAASGLMLLRSWVDQRCFPEPVTYRSINFGDLHHFLNAQRRPWAIVPSVLPTWSFWRGVRSLVRSGVPFLLPQRSLHATDVLRAVIRWGRRPKPEPCPLFQGADISLLILDDQRRDWVLGRSPTNALLGAAVRRWAEAGIPIHTFIYTFENHLWEKAFCLAFREFFPATRLIGYQDANLPAMALNFFVARGEASMVPLPDLLITNGRYSFDLLAQGGHDPARLRRGGALRYQYLAASERGCEGLNAKDRPDGGNGLFVLVTTSIGEPLAFELVWKVIQAFRSEVTIPVVLKCHPGLPFPALSSRLGIGSLPDHITVSHRPVPELLPRAAVLLYMDSTTSLEALALGVPLIHVSSDYGLDFDPLDGVPEVRASVRDPEQLFKAVRAVLDSPARATDRTRCGQELSPKFFEPVDESVYRLFLGETPLSR